MERKIYINDTASNNVITLTTNATTFGEVKAAAIAAGVNVDGKDWLEGITKTSFKFDEAQLPSNVNYKGNLTNDLVFVLTNTNKKVKSGTKLGTRAEIYACIKNNNLQEDIKKAFGHNFTQVSSSDLISFINRALAKKSKNACTAVAKKEVKEEAPATTVNSKEELVAIMVKVVNFLGIKEEVAKALTTPTLVSLSMEDVMSM